MRNWKRLGLVLFACLVYWFWILAAVAIVKMVGD
nr:MAG TPA: hypothetical protein [Caudoviricetes sp.]